MISNRCNTLSWTLKRYSGVLRETTRAHDVNNKSIYWQFRDSMSHAESQPQADLVFNKLITYNFLSGDLQTAEVITAGNVTLPESWLVSDTLLTMGQRNSY